MSDYHIHHDLFVLVSTHVTSAERFVRSFSPVPFLLSTPMATAASTRTRRPHVTPSLVKSETFLFTLLIVALAIYVPYMFRTGRGNYVPLTNSTSANSVYSGPAALGTPPSPITVPSSSGAGVPPVTGGSPAQVATQSGDQRPAPISYIIPYALALARGILSFIVRLPVLIYRLVYTTILRPLSYPLALILAVLRPVTLLLEVIYDVFLRIPLAFLSWFVREAIYPLSVIIS